MKHSLIVGVAVALIAMTALARAAEPAWIADPKTGCKVWDPAPAPNESITWSGGCEKGLAHGEGVLQWFLDGKPYDRFEGGYSDGRMSGHGVTTFASGNRYEGEFRDDKENGHGVFVWANGERYVGEWRDSNFNGHGVYVGADGNHFEGEWRDDRPNGYGIDIEANGERYDGEWSNGCFRQGDREMTINVTKEECGF